VAGTSRTSAGNVLVIINPVSGPPRRGSAGERVDIATRTVASLGGSALVRLTERAGHAYELACESAASGVELVIAWGGDGTINEVGRALVEQSERTGRHHSALGIVPGGSGNGLARELRIPFDPARAIERALRAPVRQIDAGELGGRLFLNVAGVGLDAHVAARVSTRVDGRGLLHYVKASTLDILRYKPVDYTVTSNGSTTRTSALIVAVANSKQYGFNAQIAPAAALDDGLLDLVTVEDRGILGNLVRIPSVFLGRLDRQDGVHMSRVSELTICSREAMLFHVDGEAVQGSDTLVARVHPGALRLRA